MEKRKKAAALKYEKGKDNAPKLVAKGEDLIAEKILQIAEENQIFIKEDKELIEVLSTLDLYQEIPEELYQVIAEVLVYIYKSTK